MVVGFASPGSGTDALAGGCPSQNVRSILIASLGETELIPYSNSSSLGQGALREVGNIANVMKHTPHLLNHLPVNLLCTPHRRVTTLSWR